MKLKQIFELAKTVAEELKELYPNVKSIELIYYEECKTSVNLHYKVIDKNDDVFYILLKRLKNENRITILEKTTHYRSSLLLH